MLDAVCSAHSLSVLLSAVETTCTPQIALALAWWPLSEIISTRVRVPCMLATATSPGRYLFCSELSNVWLLFKSGNYSRVASIRRNTVFTLGLWTRTFIKHSFINGFQTVQIMFCTKVPIHMHCIYMELHTFIYIHVYHSLAREHQLLEHLTSLP